MNTAEIKAALSNGNVKAFLRVIRAGESSQDDTAYRLINGGGHFASFDTHPYAHLLTTQGGKAAGAYQFLPSTWDVLAKRYPDTLVDFSPASQDFAAVALIGMKGALQNVIDGELVQALDLLKTTWVSFTTTKDLALVYLQYGGSPPETQPAAPVEEKSQDAPANSVAPTVPTQGTSMPLVLALMPVLAQLVPQLLNVFKPGQDPNARVTAAAQVVADAVTTATGSPNLQSAIEQMQNDPAAKAAAVQAINGVWYQITEVGGGGISGARAATLAAAAVPAYKNVAVIVTVLLLPAVYAVIYAVLFTPGYSEQLRTVVVTAIVLSTLGGITGYFYGTSLSSSKKDDALAAQATQP